MAASESERPRKEPEIELRPDGWERFVKAVHAAAKSGPKHRTSGGPKHAKHKHGASAVLHGVLKRK